MDADKSNERSVAILMGTFNGKKYLREQLDSINNQSHKNWRLIVSDDGSSDGTLELLEKYRSYWGSEKLVIKIGRRQGFSKNFLSLACDPDIQADYFAFCDQDDVWLPDKIEISIRYHERFAEQNLPRLYCGRTIYVDKNLKLLGKSPNYIFPPSFRNALIQSIAGGNTMVFNKATKILLEKIGIVDHPSHDWWLYQIVTASGGTVYFDDNPKILYRQHPEALFGSNTSMVAKLVRIYLVINGQFKLWTDKNLASLLIAEQHLTDSSKDIILIFKKMRKASVKDRIRLLEVSGLYRQTWRGTLSLVLAALFKKI